MEGEGNLIYSSWTKKSLADRLELPQNLQQLDIIDKALEVLKSSPLLKGTFPRLPKRSPRKREDYKCGICGKKKRNHICNSSESQGGGGKQNFEEEDDDRGEEDDDYEEDVDRDDSDLSNLPPTKKRKKTFKPLVVVMHDNQNTAVQGFLYQVKMLGEKMVEPKLSIAANGDNDYNIFGHIVIPQIPSIMCVGKISDGYKEVVRKSMEDQTLVKIELQPLQQIQSNSPMPIWLVQFVLHRNSSWRTKKLIEIESINKVDE
jgi:hypothetical protein